MGSIKILHHFGFQELVKRVANSCICHARHLQKPHNSSWSGRKITMQEKNLQCVFFHLLLLLQTNEIVWSDCNAHLLRERIQISASGHTDADQLGTDFFRFR